MLADFVAASAVMMGVESVNGRVFYPELGKMAEGVTDRETIRALLASAPVGAFLVVVSGWAAGSFAGGLLTLAGIANNLMLPPPAWFWIPTLLVFLPAAYAGARVAMRGDRASRA